MKQRSLETVPGNPACCRGRTAVHEEKEERAPFAVAAWARAAPRRPCSGESPGSDRGAGKSPRAVRVLRGRGRALPGRPRGGEGRRGLGIGPARAEAGPRRSRRVGARGGGVVGRGSAARRAARGGRAARGSWAGSGLGAGPAARRGRAADPERALRGEGGAGGGCRAAPGMPRSFRAVRLSGSRAGLRMAVAAPSRPLSAAAGRRRCRRGVVGGLPRAWTENPSLSQRSVQRCAARCGTAAGRRSPERCCWDIASLNGLLRKVFSKTLRVFLKHVIVTFIL